MNHNVIHFFQQKFSGRHRDYVLLTFVNQLQIFSPNSIGSNLFFLQNWKQII